MTFLSFFAGIGGFDKGFCDGGLECLGHVEINSDCHRILEKHWPNAPRFSDICAIRVDKAANVIYDARHGWTEEELLRSGQTLRERAFSCGGGKPISGHPTGDVGHSEAARSDNENEAPIPGGQSLLSRRQNGERQGSEHLGDSDSKGNCGEEIPMRELLPIPDNERWKDGYSSPSSGLQFPSQSDVAMSEMSSRVAQKKQVKKGKEVNEESYRPIASATVDVVVGGFP